MLTRTLIQKLFAALNEELVKLGAKGEVGICGGAVMCLVFQTREATKDIDGIFEPTREIRAAGRKVAARFGISEDWLNDAAKAYFHADPPREGVLELSNLRVWAPSAEYMLAMKCISARFDGNDRGDVQFLLRYLELPSPEAAYKIIEKYYPQNRIPAKTRFLLEEIFEGEGPLNGEKFK
ncbi:hypothetical protein FBR05_09035 [Deltaproteobacteria bacterium PRO3]|nr:hypothetical protein [Deltaproteobacteria bacterium PRO3]